jgi:hypothetical protein
VTPMIAHIESYEPLHVLLTAAQSGSRLPKEFCRTDSTERSTSRMAPCQMIARSNHSYHRGGSSA